MMMVMMMVMMMMMMMMMDLMKIVMRMVGIDYSQMSLKKRAAYRSVLFDDKDSDDNDDDDDGDGDGFDENCDEYGWHSTLR